MQCVGLSALWAYKMFRRENCVTTVQIYSRLQFKSKRFVEKFGNLGCRLWLYIEVSVSVESMF